MLTFRQILADSKTFFVDYFPRSGFKPEPRLTIRAVLRSRRNRHPREMWLNCALSARDLWSWPRADVMHSRRCGATMGQPPQSSHENWAFVGQLRLGAPVAFGPAASKGKADLVLRQTAGKPGAHFEPRPVSGEPSGTAAGRPRGTHCQRPDTAANAPLGSLVLNPFAGNDNPTALWRRCRGGPLN